MSQFGQWSSTFQLTGPDSSHCTGYTSSELQSTQTCSAWWGSAGGFSGTAGMSSTGGSRAGCGRSVSLKYTTSMVFPLGSTTRLTKWVCSPLLSISRLPCSRYRHGLTELEEKFRSSRAVRPATAPLLTQRALGRTTLVARFGGFGLAVVVAAELGMAVRPLRRTVQCHERELGDGEPRTKHDRDRVEVGDLERQRPPKARIDEARGGVDDQPEPAQGAVVGGDERAADQEEAARVGHLDAANRDARDAAHVHDRAIEVEAPALLLPRELARQPEDRLVRRESDVVLQSAVLAVEGRRLNGHNRLEPQARHELAVLLRERPADGRQLAATPPVDVAVGVHQPLEQSLPLGDRRLQVVGWDGLVAEDPHRAEAAVQRVVRGEPARDRVAPAGRAADSVFEPAAVLHRIARELELAQDRRIGASDVRGASGAVADPHAEDVGIDGQVLLRVPDRIALGHVVVVLPRAGLEGSLDLPGGQDLRGP